MEKSQAQGRFYLSNTPVASPGHCAICGYSGSERQYLDPRLDFEFFGSVIFCDTCVSSMASMFGFIEPAQALALEAKVEEAERELIKLRAAAAAMEDLSVAFASLGYGTGSGTTARFSVADPVVSSANSDVEGNAEGEGQGSSEVDFVDFGEGPDDLRDTGSDKSYSLDL